MAVVESEAHSQREESGWTKGPEEESPEHKDLQSEGVDESFGSVEQSHVQPSSLEMEEGHFDGTTTTLSPSIHPTLRPTASLESDYEDLTNEGHSEHGSNIAESSSDVEEHDTSTTGVHPGSTGTPLQQVQAENSVDIPFRPHKTHNHPEDMDNQNALNIVHKLRDVQRYTEHELDHRTVPDHEPRTTTEVPPREEEDAGYSSQVGSDEDVESDERLRTKLEEITGLTQALREDTSGVSKEYEESKDFEVKEIISDVLRKRKLLLKRLHKEEARELKGEKAERPVNHTVSTESAVNYL